MMAVTGKKPVTYRRKLQFNLHKRSLSVENTLKKLIMQHITIISAKYKHLSYKISKIL